MVTEITTKHGDIVVYVDDNVISEDLETFQKEIRDLINQYQDLPNIFFLNTFPMKIEKFENHLCLFEPDYLKTPINWIVGIEKTMKLIRYQLDTEKSFIFKYDKSNLTISNSLLVGNDISTKSNEIFMTRTDSSNEIDSGWFIGNITTTLDYNNTLNIKKISLYEAFCLNIKIAWFINFPNDLLIFLETNHFKILDNEELIGPVKNSFFDAIIK